MKRAIEQVLAFSVLCCGASNGAEPIAVSDPYYEEIFLGLGIDPESPDIWASGSRHSVTDQNTKVITAYYNKVPTSYDDRLCIVEHHQRRAEVADGTVSWKAKLVSYNAWLASSQGCQSAAPYSEPPYVAVKPNRVTDPEVYLQPDALLEPEVDFEDVIFILENEAAIFSEFLTGLTPKGNTWGWTTHRLQCITKVTHEISNLGKGPFLRLDFESPAGQGSGPIVFIQISDEEVLIREFGIRNHGCGL